MHLISCFVCTRANPRDDVIINYTARLSSASSDGLQLFKPAVRFSPIKITQTRNVTGRRRNPKRKFRVGYIAPSLKRTSHASSLYSARHYVAMRFHRRVWYRALCLRYACIRNSGIILIL